MTKEDARAAITTAINSGRPFTASTLCHDAQAAGATLDVAYKAARLEVQRCRNYGILTDSPQGYRITGPLPPFTGSNQSGPPPARIPPPPAPKPELLSPELLDTIRRGFDAAYELGLKNGAKAERDRFCDTPLSEGPYDPPAELEGEHQGLTEQVATWLYTGNDFRQANPIEQRHLRGVAFNIIHLLGSIGFTGPGGPSRATADGGWDYSWFFMSNEWEIHDGANGFVANVREAADVPLFLKAPAMAQAIQAALRRYDSAGAIKRADITRLRDAVAGVPEVPLPEESTTTTAPAAEEPPACPPTSATPGMTTEDASASSTKAENIPTP